jgi:Putative Ice-binding-like adhesive domain
MTLAKVSFTCRFFTIAAMACSLAFLLAPCASADSIPLGAAANYSVLYEGTGGHNLSITNVTINGNIGVGGTGVVQDGGPSFIGGQLDFSAANSGQFHNNNVSKNVGPSSVTYNNPNVTSALSTVNSLNTGIAGLAGTSLAISNGNTTVNAINGTLDVFGGHDYRVFDVTSYSQVNGNVFTINGDPAGDIVVFNFTSGVNLGGDTTLNGLTSDQVLWNFTGSGNVQLNNNASSFPFVSFQGVILAPGNVMSMTNANLNGRFFGGDSGDMQIVSGDTINVAGVTPPPPVPEPSTLALSACGILLGLGFAALRRL